MLHSEAQQQVGMVAVCHWTVEDQWRTSPWQAAGSLGTAMVEYDWGEYPYNGPVLSYD